MEPTYDVVWPSSPQGVQARSAAPRPSTLDGGRVAFLWDHLFRGDEIFPALEVELRRRFPDVEVVGYETFGNIHGPDEAKVVAELPARLADERIDAVVSGLGC